MLLLPLFRLTKLSCNCIIHDFSNATPGTSVNETESVRDDENHRLADYRYTQEHPDEAKSELHSFDQHGNMESTPMRYGNTYNT